MDDAILEAILTYAFAALAAVAALGFVGFRQPVYAALSFAVAVLSGSGLYLLQHAPFAAAATVIVYAGATIIIFLFVLMFAQRSHLQIYDEQKANLFRSSLAALALISVLHYATSRYQNPSVITAATANETVNDANVPLTIPPPTVADLGRVMYTQYLWAIELAGAIILVATVGAIHLARDPDNEPQLSRTITP